MQEQISAGFAYVAQKLNSLHARAVPTGGATGQVLTKVSAADHDLAWTTVSGASGVTATLTSTYLTVTPAKFEMAEIEIANELVVGTSLIVVSLIKSDEFDLDDLADVQVRAEALTGAIRFTLFSEIIVGSYLIAYQVYN